MARAIWTGSISFGLVSVGVRMYTATESKEIHFNMLDAKDLTPISYEKVRADDRSPVPAERITRGYELEKGRFVEIEDDEIERLRPALSHTIDIQAFADLADIDPLYFKKGYWLGPAKGAEKPYRLLVQALADTGKVGVATVVMRNKQHLACLRPLEGLLVLETMYRADEVRGPGDLDVDLGRAELTEAEIEMAKLLVDRLAGPFQPEAVPDTYRDELLELIRAKAEGTPLAPVAAAAPAAPAGDLMEALRASVEAAKAKVGGGAQAGAGSSPAAAPAKKKAAAAKAPEKKPAARKKPASRAR